MSRLAARLARAERMAAKRGVGEADVVTRIMFYEMGYDGRPVPGGKESPGDMVRYNPRTGERHIYCGGCGAELPHGVYCRPCPACGYFMGSYGDDA